MAIMVAGGLTFAIPGAQPAMAQSTNPNLSVSAESSTFGNYFSGPQVVEIVIIDPDIDETNEQKGEPDVTINGNDVRMLQATDGKWYAYVAEYDQAVAADATVGDAVNAGKGLDFGTICTEVDAADVIGRRNAANDGAGGNPNFFSEARAVAFPFQKATYDTVGDENPNPTVTTCSIADTAEALAAPTATSLDAGMAAMNVVREAKELNAGITDRIGQTIVRTTSTAPELAGLWPFVQLYDFNTTGTVEIQYNRGGGTQSVTLNYDDVDDYASLALDRAIYPNNAEVHFTITDTWLDIDPTDEDSWSWAVAGDSPGAVYYQKFDENGDRQDKTITSPSAASSSQDVSSALTGLMCDDNCRLLLNPDAQRTGVPVVVLEGNGDSNPGLDADITEADDSPPSVLLTVTETEASSGVFTSYDESDQSALVTGANPPRGTTATIDYNETPQSITVGYAFATIDIQPTGDAWLSGQEIPVVLTDADANRNSLSDEDLDVLNVDHIIPTLVTGSPVTLAGASAVAVETNTDGPTTTASGTEYTTTTGAFDSGAGVVTVAELANDPSLRATVDFTGNQRFLVIDYGTAAPHHSAGTVTTVFNYDFGGLEFASPTEANRNVDVYALVGTAGAIFDSATNLDTVTPYSIATNAPLSGTAALPEAARTQLAGAGTSLGLMAEFGGDIAAPADPVILIADVMSFGFTDDGEDAGERHANQVVRLELEETADDSGVFEGSLEYAMVNQLTIAESSTYSGLAFISDEGTLIAIEDLTDEDTLTVTYNDLGQDGVVTPVSDDEAALSHSGTVSFDATSYKIADTVTVTVLDADLNTSSDTTEVYTIPAQPATPNFVSTTLNTAVTADQRAAVPIHNAANSAHVGEIGGVYDTTEVAGGTLGRMLDITFDDSQWEEGITFVVEDFVPDTPNAAARDVLRSCVPGGHNGLRDTGFTLRETSAASGVFEGDFQIPARWCAPGQQSPASVTGLDMEVNYVDYRDASGEIIEVGDGAGVRASTGSVSLDRPVYPVPFGTAAVGENDLVSRFLTYEENGAGERIPMSARAASVHVRVTDPDYDVSASGSDILFDAVDRGGGEGDGYGPLKISVRRGSDEVVIGYAGAENAMEGAGRDVRASGAVTAGNAIDYGPIAETAPSSGVFELDLAVEWDHGPMQNCPSVFTAGCVLQGDILLVEYTDTADASGSVQTVTDSATFDMRNAVLRSDKSVYIIGSDMILTLIEPDLDLDNDTAETYPLSLIEWDDDDTATDLGGHPEFDPEPSSLRETGDSTGIFQVVVEIPQGIDGEDLERGEEIELTYQDWSPAGADYVGGNEEEIEWSIFTSDFGATIELDQAVYTWTDKVFITVVAPDHNFDSNLIDEIGDTVDDPLQVSTREGDTLRYRLTETGTDTGIFSGEVILTGFAHDADGDADTGDGGNDRAGEGPSGSGPTDGMIPADDDDGITVSYEYNDDEHVIGSALIRWNVGDTQWLEASYPASGSGVVRVVDPDMNWNPEAVDNFEVDVYSDADAGGINLTVTETQEASGIFEGTVVFTLNAESSGHRLRVAEGDTVTARYDDNTLPDPYTRNDELEVEGTTIIGTLVPPLERAVVSNVRLTDNSGNPLDTVAVGQQVQVTGQVTSGQETEQAYAYLVQVNDSSDVTLSLTWTSGTLNAGQSLTPSMSWQPTVAGDYTATVFVWESIDNPTALSPQAELPFTVG